MDLQRFVDAQADVYPTVVEELRAGRKRSHWMWFVFPQIQGLGSSPMAEAYAIGSRDEARAYAEHPIVGTRLRECTQLVLDATGRTVAEIFGYPDHLKFRSSMTLFAMSAADAAVFQAALVKYYAGAGDPLTLAILGRDSGAR
jgi:uncharacterized protein (DUF1810 family)